MEYVQLNDGNKIPAIGFGVFMIPNDGPTYEAALEALKAGYRHIDSAAAYFNERGVGEGIKKAGIARDKIFVTTKVAAEHKDYKSAMDGIDESLRKMGLGYASSSIRSCENDIKHLNDFMEKEEDVLYCIEVGQRYLSSDYCNSTDIKRAVSESFISQLNDCLFRGKFNLYHCRKEVVSAPDRYFVLEEAYTKWCKEKGNGPITLQHKHHAFACFFSFLESIGCDDVSGITPERIIKAVSNEKSPDNHRYFREILKFLAEKKIITFDYSALIPKARSSFHLPSTYDKDERKLLESSPDRSTALGKRNYSIMNSSFSFLTVAIT